MHSHTYREIDSAQKILTSLDRPSTSPFSFILKLIFINSFLLFLSISAPPALFITAPFFIAEVLTLRYRYIHRSIHF